MLVFVVALVVALLVRIFGVQTFEVTSSSMENTLLIGDRVVVEKASKNWREFARGDIVVFDGAGSFLPERVLADNAPVHFLQRLGAAFGIGPSAKEVFVKRVIGVAGDSVRCCNASGELLVNGQPLTEPYLFPDDSPSDVAFDVVVPEGKLWLLGDHRSVSSDARAHLGSPGGGMVSVDRVIGLARFILWPRDRISSLTSEREQ